MMMIPIQVLLTIEKFEKEKKEEKYVEINALLRNEFCHNV